jgi:hypothetical protein
MVFLQHSLMVTHFQEYATRKGFLHAEHTKQSFTTEKFSYFFSGESNHLLGSNTIQTTTQSRRCYFCCSPKISWPYQGCRMLLFVPYFWNASQRNFMICSKGSNLSHNHQLCSQLTVIDGQAIVNLESSLTPEDFSTIKERSQC